LSVSHAVIVGRPRKPVLNMQGWNMLIKPTGNFNATTGKAQK
jgi:hypothetical protein